MRLPRGPKRVLEQRLFTTLASSALGIRIPFERQLELASANGFGALDLPVGHLLALSSSSTVDQISQRFSTRDLRSGGWQLPFDFMAPKAEFARGLRRLSRVASLAGQLRSEWCFYWIEPTSDELSFAANTAKHVERLRPIADVLVENGCRIGLEPIGPQTLRLGHRYEFVHTISMALDLLSAIDRANVGLLLDCFHWYTSCGTVDELKGLAASQVVYVHLNDAPAGPSIDEQLDDVRLLPGANGVLEGA